MQFGKVGMRLFCFGYGYVAQHLAQSLRAQGIIVTGTHRHVEKTVEEGSWIFSPDSPLSPAARQALQEATHVLVSIPPEGGEEPALQYRDLMHNKWLGYLSTTGVYGNTHGEWVDEESPLLATAPRSLRRIAAERQWQQVGAQIFRLAGIYGPGRNVLEQVRRGTARRIIKPGQVFSRIHVADIVQVLQAAISHSQPGEIYNLCDDLPAPQHEVVAYACTLLGQELPPAVPFEQAELSPMAASFYADNRRVCNRKIKDKLGVRLLYPDYRSGLASILHDEEK